LLRDYNAKSLWQRIQSRISLSTEVTNNQTERAGFVSALLKRLPMTVFWALAAQGFVSVTRILTTVTVGGRFAPDESPAGAMLGSLDQLSLYYAAFGVLTVLIAMHEGFVTTPLTVFLPKQGKERESKFSGHMLLASLCFIGISLCFVAIWLLYQYQIGGGMTAALMVISFVVVLAPLQLLREFSRRWLLANLEVRSSALLEILFSFTFLSCLAALFYFQHVSAIRVFVSIAVVNVIALSAWWFFYRTGFEVSHDGSSKQLKESFRYGRWAAGENFCSSITMFYCVWFLLREMGTEAGGVYSACFNVMLLANPFLLGVCSLLGARAAQEFTKGGWDAMLKTLTQYGTFVFVVLVGFSIGLWFFGADLTNLLFTQKNQEWFDANAGGINRVTPVLGLAVPCLGVSFVLSTALLAIGRPNDNFICALSSLAILIVINAIYGPSLIVAAISYVIAMAANGLLRVVCLTRAWIARKSVVAKVA